MAGKQLIGEVARSLGINPKTIRYYEEIGLIPAAQRAPSGYRLYDQGAVERLDFILRAKALDFSLDDIGEILAFRERGEAPCRYVAGLIGEKIAQIDARIEALRRLREDLVVLDRDAQSIPLETLDEKDCICHLIENRAHEKA